MSWNNGYERKKFEERMTKQAKEYRKAGMTEEQIKAMYEFDLAQFNSDRAFYTHTQPLDIHESNDEGEEVEDSFVREFIDVFSVSDEDEYLANSSRFGWIETIENPALARELLGLSSLDKEIITRTVFEGYKLKDLVSVLNVPYRTLTLRSVIREAIDVAIKGSVSQQQFLAAMDEMGFVIDQHGKHPKIKQVGNERFVRFDSLGPGYSVNEIIGRIYNNEEIEYPDIPTQESPKQIFEEDKPVEKMNYIEVNRCYFKALTVTRERPKTNRRMYFLIRQDHSAMRIYQDQLNLVTEHHLTSEAEVRAYKIKAMADIDSLTETRRQLWAEFKRAQRLKGSDGETLSGKIRMTITQCTSSLSKLRREVTSCDEVLERIDRMRENLMRIEQSKFRGKEQPVRFAPDKDKVTEQIIRTKNQREEVRKK